MCMIIDANSIGLFLKNLENKDDENYLNEIRLWMETRQGKFAYFPHREFSQFSHSIPSRKPSVQTAWLENQRLGNRIKLIPKAQVEKIQRDIEKAGGYNSDDPHILALCLAARATVVFTEDEALRDDIANLPRLKNVRLYGESYYRSEGKRGVRNKMLTPDTCP